MEQEQQLSGPFISSSHLSIIAVIQMIKEHQFMGFALGIFSEGRLVSLSKYFENGVKPGKAYLHKQGLKEPFANSFLINLGNKLTESYDVVETKGKTRIIGDNNFFVQIKLKDDIQRESPPLISENNFSYSSYSSGLAIGFIKSDTELRLRAITFDANQTANLSLPLSVGVLLFNKAHDKWTYKQLIYGFYDNLADNKQGGEDYFLSKESMEKDQEQNQVYIPGQKVEQVKTLFKQFPYNSIAILEIAEKYTGTASFLLSNDGTSRFIITCAHNFYNFADRTNIAGQSKIVLEDFTSKEQLAKYRIGVAKEMIAEQPGRYSIFYKPDFKIKNVYIPKGYMIYVDNVVQKQDKNANEEKIGFPDIIFSGEKAKEEINIAVQRQSFWDIAIIQLQTPLKMTHGFRIQRKEKNFDGINKKKIEVAGFPKTVGIYTNYKTMYRESTEEHGVDYVRLSNTFDGANAKGWRVLKHKLSTFGGNSGSPIYEMTGEQKAYLFGIHTTGVGFNNWGTHNFGTYLYSQNIRQWLSGIPEIDQVIDA